MAGTKIRGITIELNADTAGILDGIKDVNRSLATTDKALKDVNKLLKFDPNSTELLTQQQEYLNQAITQTEEKLKKEKELLEALQNADNSEETVEQQKALSREIEATTQKLNSYKSQLDQTDDGLEEVGKETQEVTQKSLTFGDVLKANIVGDMVIAGLRKLCNGIRDVAVASMSVGTEFEASMSQVAATMGMTTDEIEGGSAAYKKLEQAARECGATTQYTASQAAEALNYLALAGYDAEKAAETLPKVLTLAAAGGMDLAYASDLITDAMSAMGMSTEDLDKYIDEMAKTAQKANTSVSQLGEATLVCAGATTLTGQSLETMNTELGILANNGIKGAEGGTHLRNVLLSLSAPTDKAAAALESLHVNVKDSNGDLRDLNDIMIDLNAALAGMGSADKAAVIKQIFNKTDIAAVNALLKGSGEEFQNLSEQIKNSEGAAKAMADTMMDNLKGKITILKSALEGLGIAFSGAFQDDAKIAVTSATEAVDQLTDAIENGELGVSLQELSDEFEILMQDCIDFAMDALPGIIEGATWFLHNLPEIIDILKGVVAGYVAYEAAVVASTIATEGLTVALNANPIGLAVGAVVGLTTAFVGLYDSLTGLDPEIENYIRSMDRASEQATEYAQNSKGMMDKLNVHGEYIQELCERLEELQNKTSLTAAEQKEEEEIVRKLNAAIPGLNAFINEQGQVLSETTDDWHDYIDAQMEETRVEAIKERLLEIDKKLVEQEEQLFDAESHLAEELGGTLESEREHIDLLERVLVDTDSLTEAEEERLQALNETGFVLDKATSEWLEAAINTKASIEELTSSQEYLRNSLEETAQTAEDTASATDDVNNANKGAAESTETLSEMLDRLVDDYGKAKEKAVESLEGQREAFENMNEGASESVDEIKEHLEKQAEAMKQYAEDIAAAEAIMEADPEARGLLNYYIEQGPAAAGELEALIEAWNEGGESLQTFMEACEAFNDTETMIEGLADLNLAIGTGTQEAIDLALEAIQTNMPEMQASLLENWELQQQDAEANRTKMTETTTGTMTDMKQAVVDNTQPLVDAMKQAQEKVYNETQTYLGWTGEHYSKWWDVGLKIDQSIATGITDNADLIAEAVSSAVDSAISAIDFSGLTAGINVALGAALGG